jgi:hypothetical protein
MRLAKTLGLDVAGDTWRVAAAKILDVVGPAIGDCERHSEPTARQVKHAADVGVDLAGVSFRVACAKIADYWDLQNQLSIERQQLKPGDTVSKRNDPLRQRWVISSIAADGTVFFKGGNGQRAMAANLSRARG